MLLLDLPAELIREILYALDPESFYICLQANSTFRKHALESTDLLKAQLMRIPGQRHPDAFEYMDAKVLLQTFGRRCAQHLLTGGQWMADFHVWRSLPQTDRKISTLIRWIKPADTEDAELSPGSNVSLQFAEVWADNAIVNIYDIKNDGHDGYKPELQHAIYPHSLSRYLFDPVYEYGPEDYKVVKIAQIKEEMGQMFGPMIGVLYSPKIWPKIEDETVSLKLIIFKFDEQFGPIVDTTFDVFCLACQYVVSMAITYNCEPIVVFRACNTYKYDHSIVSVYKIERDWITGEHRTVRDSEDISYTVQIPGERISDISITSDSTVHLHRSTFPLPQWTMPNLPGFGDRLERRDTLLPDTIGAFPKPSLGKAIAHHHHHEIECSKLNGGEKTCVNTALELMISRDDVDENDLPCRTGAYLLKAIHYPDFCREFRLDKDYRSLMHVYVAHLAGLPDLHNISTLGFKIAVSPTAQRIAIASWKTVKVWALNPSAFLDPWYSLSGRSGVPDDYAFVQESGWEYYNSELIFGDCVVLQPIELPSTGVVFGLEFRHEDELWGWCEHGLVKWKFGVYMKEKTEYAWLESAVSKKDVREGECKNVGARSLYPQPVPRSRTLSRRTWPGCRIINAVPRHPL